jgi:hypothetical protein
MGYNLMMPKDSRENCAPASVAGKTGASAEAGIGVAKPGEITDYS